MFFLFSYKPYVAIIGDIKKSKSLANRNSIQEKMNSVLYNINQKYKSDIAARFMITLGDEFQGLLCGGSNVFNIIEDIRREMYPVEIRFGIGIGAITTEINADMAIGADGPGYYCARYAVEYLKQNEKKYKTQEADIRIEIEDDHNSIALMLNTIFSLMTAIRSKWSERQREIIWEYERAGEDNQGKCAERMGLSPSSVQRSLNNADYYAYKNARDTVNDILKEIKGDHV